MPVCDTTPMNPDLSRLHPYPFEQLARLTEGIEPPRDLEPIALSIGEPKHPAPGFIIEEVITHLHGLATYPTTKGILALREAISQWLTRRFRLPEGTVDPEHNVLPVNGTREALFAFAQAVVDRTRQPRVLMPNPFYQIYEGAALLAGAEPGFLNTLEAQGFLPDIDNQPEALWHRCQLLYLCNPGNPTGAVIDRATLARLIERAETYDFIIAADECYSEIYFDEDDPPPGLLEAAAHMGNTDYRRCVVFHSLSKRSNVPGLRSGFVAGDAAIIQRFFRYRTYHGCAMPPPIQAASRVAWRDERHVRENRARYREKFKAVLDILGDTLAISRPAATFYLWPRSPFSDTQFARALYAQQNITVLPGRFLSRKTAQGDPGEHRVRLALVPPLADCVEAAHRIRAFLDSL